MGVDPEPSDLDDRLVFEDVVVRRQHRRVLGGDADLVARVADGGHRLDVVPVAVRFEHRAYAERLAQLEQLLVFVGGVEQHRLARLVAADHEHVVVHRADHVAVDLHATVGPMECHGVEVTGPRRAGPARRQAAFSSSTTRRACPTWVPGEPQIQQVVESSPRHVTSQLGHSWSTRGACRVLGRVVSLTNVTLSGAQWPDG